MRLRDGSAHRGGIFAFHLHADLTFVGPLMAMEQPLRVESIVDVMHQTLEQPPPRRIYEQIAKARRGEQIRVFEARLSARELASITRDERNAALLHEHEPERLKPRRVQRQYRFDGHLY
jgi:hypothetical protein